MSFPGADVRKDGGYFIKKINMIVFKTTVYLGEGDPITDRHSTKQSAVVSSLKHKNNPNVDSIYIHKTKITIKGEEVLEEVYKWENPNRN